MTIWVRVWPRILGVLANAIFTPNGHNLWRLSSRHLLGFICRQCGDRGCEVRQQPRRKLVKSTVTLAKEADISEPAME